MKFASQEKEPIQLQMGPLIDVVFLLLIFFLIATVFKMERQLTSPLPGVSTKEVPKEIPKQITINITTDGRVLIHKKEYGLPSSEELSELRTMLTEFTQFFKDPVVIIIPDKGVKYNRVVNVLDACAAADISKISFAAVAAESK
ncbi:biopolymer transporter ExbD [candidate division WOR-3 bacterium]|nr:biopolymer transporter ExbD [candidate division WOR-3 bacterium]MCK4595278.1 biopolymer transporter ExbD [candidate division WOR-3 bacterium]